MLRGRPDRQTGKLAKTMAPSNPDRVCALVERIQAGIDYESGCEDLYREFRRRVYSFFSVRGFSSDDCRELTQETFVRVFSGIGTLHLAPRFPSWLFEIAGNLYRNELRRRGTAKRHAFEESFESLVESGTARQLDHLAALSSKSPGQLENALRREGLASLRSELDRLPPQMRRCVYLRLYQDLKYREIAAVMHISIETVKAHLHQAQRRLMIAFSTRLNNQENRRAV